MRLSLVLPAVAPIAAVAAGSAVAEPLVQLQGEGVGLAVSAEATQPDHPQVESQARLTAGGGALETRVQLGLGAGEKPTAGPAFAPGWWNSQDANVGATWRPAPGTQLELGARSATRAEFDPADPVFVDGSQHYVVERQSGASAAATLKPLSPVELKLGAQVESSLSQTGAASASGWASSDALQTEARRVTANLAVTPLSGVTLEGGGRLQATAVDASGLRAEALPAFDPRAGLKLAPWTGGDLRLSLERSSQALSTDQFIGGLPGAEAGGLVLPASREWRYSAALNQSAGPIDLSASVLAARLTSYAYLGPGEGEGRAWRAAAGEGERSQLTAALKAPLPLSGLTLEAGATWRASSAQDPLTGALGRLSGERPYDAALTLSRSMGGGLRWGVTAQANGPQRILTANQVSEVSATAGLGGFLQFRTRPVTVRLTLDNLLGGQREQHDVYYAGGRELNLVEREAQSRTVDRGVHISLIRPL